MGIVLLVIALALLAALLCGVFAFIRTGRILYRLNRLEAELRDLARRSPPVSTASPQERPVPAPANEPPRADAADAAGPGAPPPIPRFIADAGSARTRQAQPAFSLELPEHLRGLTRNLSWEMLAGTKGLLWAGVIFVTVGVALFLNYLYSLGFIDERMRLVIAAAGGAAALGLGAWFRGKGWAVISQGFTGLGIAIFYVCVYFSFHIYAFTGQTVSFILAVCVTVLAVTLAVVQDAPSIAVLAVLGGFLSPVFISTGENHPYGLFSYLALLDLVAVGVAWFKRWRFLDALCLAGTALLYSAWYFKFFGRPGEADMTVPATLYATVFYVLFLGISSIHPLVRQVKSRPEDLVVAGLNAAFWFFAFYNTLHTTHRYPLGALVLGQAVLALLVLLVWRKRVPGDAAAHGVLLVLAMGFSVLAVPILLKLYAYQITWAVQGIVFVYLGLKYRRLLAVSGGLLAWTLGGLALFRTLPLHTERFIPVFNTAFGSWACVIAAGTVLALMLKRGPDTAARWRTPAAAFAGLSALALTCFLLTAEAALFWSTRDYANYRVHQHSAVAVLWAVLPFAVILFLWAKRLYPWLAVGMLCYVAGLVLWFAGLSHFQLAESWLFLNTPFLARLAMPLSLWMSAHWIRSVNRGVSDVLTITGHVVFAVLTAGELWNWTRRTELVSDKMALSFISSAWGLQAFCLIVIGMFLRSRTQRVLGLAFFAFTIAKVWLVDLAAVEPLYRILSFIAVGLLLLPASVLYQRFSDRLAGEQAANDTAKAGSAHPS